MLQPEQRPRVIIVEDSVLIQQNIRRAVQAECEIVGACEEGEAVFEAVASLAPDILLLDVSLPGMNGFAVAEQLKLSDAPVDVIFVTAHRDQDYEKRAFEIGAKAYVLKGRMWSELPAAIRAVAQGGTWRPPLPW